MKFKKLGFETKEGLSLANFSDGWSMEYGEGGSYCVDILYHGKKFASAIEEGNGGALMVYYDVKCHEAEDNAVLAFLRRTNKDYQAGSKYDFCVNATRASDIEYSTLINALLEEYDSRKIAKKYFKQGQKMVMFITNGYNTRYIASPYDDEQRLKDYANNKGYIDGNVDVRIIKQIELEY